MLLLFLNLSNVDITEKFRCYETFALILHFCIAPFLWTPINGSYRVILVFAALKLLVVEKCSNKVKYLAINLRRTTLSIKMGGIKKTPNQNIAVMFANLHLFILRLTVNYCSVQLTPTSLQGIQNYDFAQERPRFISKGIVSSGYPFTS